MNVGRTVLGWCLLSTAEGLQVPVTKCLMPPASRWSLPQLLQALDQTLRASPSSLSAIRPNCPPNICVGRRRFEGNLQGYKYTIYGSSSDGYTYIYIYEYIQGMFNGKPDYFCRAFIANTEIIILLLFNIVPF